MSWNSGQVRNISRVDETLLEATLYASSLHVLQIVPRPKVDTYQTIGRLIKGPHSHDPVVP